MLSSYSKSILIFTIYLAIAAFLFSCQKTEKEEKAEIVEQAEIILNDENLKYLENTIDFMEYFAMLKKFNIPFENNVATVEQYSQQTDSRKKMIRFGMLCSDIAYQRLIGGATQTPEYDELYQRFVKELNLTTIMQTTYFDYLKMFAENELTDDFFNKMKEMFRKDRVALVDRAKNSNEEFIIYFTFGNMLEHLYLARNLTQNEEVILKINQYIKQNGFPVAYLFRNIWNTTYTNEINKAVKEYVLKLKPVYEIMLDKIENHKPYTKEELIMMTKHVEDIRNEMLK